MDNISFLVPLRKRLLFLLMAVILGFVLVSVLGYVLNMAFGMSSKTIRILMVMQDLIAFILPAVGVAVISTRRPVDLLCVNKRPPLLPLLVAICVLLVGLPALNEVVYLNEHIPLPQDIIDQMQAMEEKASETFEILKGGDGVGSFIISLLIISIMAGLSEELLFRGALQRLLSTGGVSPQLSIWIAATIFSIFHFQFLGFVPRLLLGAFFGYVLLWTRCLWIPIILHMTNNALVLISEWITGKTGNETAVQTLGSGGDYAIVALSLVLTAIGLYILRRISLKTSAS